MQEGFAYGPSRTLIHIYFMAFYIVTLVSILSAFLYFYGMKFEGYDNSDYLLHCGCFQLQNGIVEDEEESKTAVMQ